MGGTVHWTYRSHVDYTCTVYDTCHCRSACTVPPRLECRLRYTDTCRCLDFAPRGTVTGHYLCAVVLPLPFLRYYAWVDACLRWVHHLGATRNTCLHNRLPACLDDGILCHYRCTMPPFLLGTFRLGATALCRRLPFLEFFHLPSGLCMIVHSSAFLPTTPTVAFRTLPGRSLPPPITACTSLPACAPANTCRTYL